MTHAPRIRRSIFAVGLIALASSCSGGTQATRVTTTEQNVQPPRVRPVEHAPDLSEVPAPDDLIATVRVASVNQIIERVGQLTGLGDMIRSQADELFNDWHSGLGSLVDRNAPVEMVVVTRGASDVDVAFAFGAPSMDEIERALANSHRLVPLQNGIRRLEVTSDSPRDAGSQHCYASPTPHPSVTRVVCSEHANVAEHMLPYIARTLTRHEPPPNAITLELSMETARRNFLGDALQQLERTRSQLDSTLSGTAGALDPALRDAVIPLAHDALDAARDLVTQPTRYIASLTFGQDRITLHNELVMHSPQSALLRAMTTAARPQGPVPTSMLAHLLPDAMMYAAGTFDESGMEPTRRQIVQIGEQLIQHDNALDAADRAAIRAALDAMPPLGSVTEAMAIGADAEGHPWVTAAIHSPTIQSAQWIGSSRAMLAAFRRPHVQAEIRRLLGLANVTLPDLGALRELPVTGLPAGSLLVQLPSFRSLTASMRPGASSAPPATPARGRRGRGAAATPAAPPMQLLLVPDGNDATMLMARDARALLQRYNANTAPAVDARFLSDPGSAMVMAMVMNGFPNMLRQNSEREAREMATALQGLPDHGSTPIVFRTGVTEADQQLHMTFEIEVTDVTVRDIVQLVTRASSSRASQPPALPPPPAPPPPRHHP